MQGWISANRNRGCGEWDYSCNTSIIDSSRVDSLKATHPTHIVSGYFEDNFEYSETPLFTYYLKDIEHTEINTVANEVDGYIDLSSSQIEVSAGHLGDVNDEITLAFWSKNAELEEIPNNSIVYSEDESNNRQLNIHLPWSNSIVYWDCGNDGSGYDRINKDIDIELLASTWNHWAFAKNTNTGIMSIYLNGELWHYGTGFTKAIDFKDLLIGTSKSINACFLFYFASQVVISIK